MNGSHPMIQENCPCAKCEKEPDCAWGCDRFCDWGKDLSEEAIADALIAVIRTKRREKQIKPQTASRAP